MPSSYLPLPLGLLCYNWVGHTTIGSVTLQSGRSHYYWVGRAIIGPSWCAFPPCHFIPLLCTLFPTAPCEGLTFTYMFPYLAPVIAALDARP